MSDKILFQRDRLTVTESRLYVGQATIFYPSISSLSIYDGRPLAAWAIFCAIGVVPLGFVFLMGTRLLGPHFPITAVAWPFVPLAIFVVVGLSYRVKCLFVSVEGSAVAVLKSQDLATLEEAKQIIEDAKSAYGNTRR